MADRINRPSYPFALKTSALGSLYLAYEQEKDLNRTFSENTCEIHESAWQWYGPALDSFDAEFLKFRNGKKPMTSEQRRIAERQLSAAITKTTRAKMYERQNEIGKAYSPVTVNMYVRCMMTWFKWLVKESILVEHQAGELEKLKMPEPKQSRTIFLPSQLDKFLKYRPDVKSLNQNRVWTGGLLMFDVGLRLEEVLDLRVNDFEWSDLLIVVNHGKGDKQRRVRMDASTIGQLLRYKTRFVDSTLQNPHFFGTRTGGRMRDDNFRRDLQVVLKKAKIATMNDGTRLTPHCFRHTAATAMLINTGDIHRVKQVLGHESIATTEKYLHVVNELLAKNDDHSSALSAGGKFRQLSRA